MQAGQDTYTHLKRARRKLSVERIAEDAIFVLMLAGIFVCSAILTVGYLGLVTDEAITAQSANDQ